MHLADFHGAVWIPNWSSQVKISARISGMALLMTLTLAQGILSAPGAEDMTVPLRSSAISSGVTFSKLSTMFTRGLGMSKGGFRGSFHWRERGRLSGSHPFPGSWSQLVYFQSPCFLLGHSWLSTSSRRLFCLRIAGGISRIPTWPAGRLFYSLTSLFWLQGWTLVFGLLCVISCRFTSLSVVGRIVFWSTICFGGFHAW